MKIGIIYSTHHGTTEAVAKEIQRLVQPQHVELINLGENKHPDISNYDVVILGSSIHASHNQSRMHTFCKKNIPELLQKQLGLYLCCMNRGEMEQSMQNAYSEILRNRAFSLQFMGGEYKMDKMNFIERILLKKIAGVTESKSSINYDAINEFVERIKEQQLRMDKLPNVQKISNCQHTEKESTTKGNYQDSLIGFMLSFDNVDFMTQS